MTPITSSFAPHIAHLHHQRRRADLGRVYRLATSWIVRLSVPAFVALLVVSEDLLGIFGDAFRVGATVTLVLAVGKFVEAATGPCGLMLVMSGHPGWATANNVVALIANVGLNLWLIPRHGIVGAAVAWAAVLCLVNLARLVEVRCLLGLLPFDASVVKGVLAGFGAAGLATAALLFVEPPVDLGVAVTVIAVGYIGLLWALGPSPEDRMMLRSARARLRLG